MTTISDLEKFQQKLVGEGLAELAVELQNIIEGMKAQDMAEYWIYELADNNGIFQGCTGADAEKLVTDTALAFEGSGKPFKVFTHPPLSDETVKDGYVMVPLEPTFVQVNAAIEAINGQDDLEADIRVCYKAMIGEAMKADK